MCRLMTLTATTMVVLAISALPAAAQGGGGGGMGGGGMGGGGDRGARMQAALFQGITLNDTQQKQIDSISAAYKASRSGATMGPGMSSDDRQKMRASMQQETADFRTVLTPDQQSVFDQNLANMRSQMRPRGGGQGGGGWGGGGGGGGGGGTPPQ